MPDALKAIAVLFCLTAIVSLGACAHHRAPMPPSSPMSAQRLDSWILIGPGGGGAQYLPTISPHDPNVVLVRCDMTGNYISTDFGESWRIFNLRTSASWFVYDPLDPQTIYTWAGGLFRSEDLGRSWHLVVPHPDRTTGITVSGDHAGWRWDTPENYERITALAIDPANSNKLYAAAGSSLLFSEDYGDTWRDIALEGGIDRGMAIFIDADSPPDDRTLFVLEANRVSVREGGEWRRYDPAPGVSRFHNVSGGWAAGATRPVIYGAAPASWRDGELEGGILVSRDGGESWQTSNRDFTDLMMEGAAAPYFPAIATCASDPSVAYVSFRNVRYGPDRWDLYFGTARTTDTGASWDLAIRETMYDASPRLIDAWVTALFHPEWGESPFGLGVAPTDPDIAFGTDWARTMRTDDGLQTWRAVFSKPYNNAWTTTGLDVTTCYGVHRDPHDPQRLFVTYSDKGLWRSEDGGTSWLAAQRGMEETGWRNTCYWMVFDPDVEGRVWSGWSRNHDLPRPKMWRGRETMEHLQGGVATSSDGGRSWRVTSDGMPPTAVTHILLDPESPADSRTLYATGFGTGVWKSTDSGATWALKNNGIRGSEPLAWRLAMDREGTIYLVVARRSEDGSLDDDYDGALYRSTDGALSWQEIHLPEGVNGPNGIHIDPRDPRRLYVAAWGRGGRGRRSTDGGVYLSADGGRSWENVFDANQFVYDVTADPRNPDTLFIAGFESSAWRSDDAGETWRRLGGFNFKWGHRVVPDTAIRDRIFVTTFGGGVWYGPADGDPDAPEDIATEHLSYRALGQ